MHEKEETLMVMFEVKVALVMSGTPDRFRPVRGQGLRVRLPRG
jgi:hypothetical protein